MKLESWIHNYTSELIFMLPKVLLPIIFDCLKYQPLQIFASTGETSTYITRQFSSLDYKSARYIASTRNIVFLFSKCKGKPHIVYANKYVRLLICDTVRVMIRVFVAYDKYTIFPRRYSKFCRRNTNAIEDNSNGKTHIQYWYQHPYHPKVQFSSLHVSFNNLLSFCFYP